MSLIFLNPQSPSYTTFVSCHGEDCGYDSAAWARCDPTDLPHNASFFYSEHPINLYFLVLFPAFANVPDQNVRYFGIYDACIASAGAMEQKQGYQNIKLL